MDKKIIRTILLLIAIATFSRANGTEDEIPYESADGICDKCNCTTMEGLLEDVERGRSFSLDCSMKNLQHLFAKWPEELGDNQTSVELIYIMSMNKLTTLQQFPTTDAVLLFTCRHCGISSIAANAFIDSPNILTLDLAYNELESSALFAEIFKGPEKDEIYAPIALQKLDLSYNKLTTLDKLIFEHTPNLKFLDLSYNALQIVDESTQWALRSLSNLEILDMSHAFLDELPENVLENKEKLSELYLNGNNFTEVPASLEKVKDSLLYLHFSENLIEKIDDESFHGLTKLKHLNISSLPKLKEIGAGSFGRLTSLEGLHCHSNRHLESFLMEDLRTLEHLKELDLSHNALNTLSIGIYDTTDNETDHDLEERFKNQFQHLRTLKLAGNPWNCDCAMLKSLEIFDHEAKYFKKMVSNDEARCASPSHLISKIIYDLPSEYVCKVRRGQTKYPFYDPPPFLRPKSIMLTVVSVVSVVILGIIIGFVIVCIKRKLSKDHTGYSASPIRYTTVRDSTISNIGAR